MRFLSAGKSALLVELADLAQALALYRAVQSDPIAGVAELVPAARTVLVQYERGTITRERLIAELLRRGNAPTENLRDTAARVVEIPVHYRGEDLAAVAQLLGLSEREVVTRHTGEPWQAAFAGFAPGFVYLAGGDACFAKIPRRAAPRVRVPAGSVALAGGFSAVYPGASPGGWQLIGVTDLPMWDLNRAEPAFIQPGFRVRFVDADAPGAHVNLPSVVAKPAQKTRAAMRPQTGPAIEILNTGLQTLFQDAGRPNKTQLGISASGALDRGAMRAANRLVGNPYGTPVLENLLGGLHLRCHGAATIAVTGATVPISLHAPDGKQWPLSAYRAIALDDGDELTIGSPTAGVRCCVAVRGGWQVEPVLGSASTDTLAKIGPPAPAAGALLAIGSAIAANRLNATAGAELTASALPHAGDTVTLDIALGPRTDWFTAQAVELLAHQAWLVTPQSDRVGIRLKGETPLARSRHDELPSEGTVAGAIQVPAGGQPVLFLADHPLTGGYPVIAVVARHHLDLAAQIPVGCRVRFNVIAPFFDETHA